MVHMKLEKAEKIKPQVVETRNQSEQAIDISSKNGMMKNSMDLIAIEMINELQEEEEEKKKRLLKR